MESIFPVEEPRPIPAETNGHAHLARSATPAPLSANCDVYLLNALSDDDLVLLASAIKSRQFGKGEVLMHEGDTGDRFYILRKGKVEVFAQGKGGKPSKHIRDLDDSATENFIGEIALLTGDRRNATVRATSDLDVWEIGRDAFAKLFAPAPRPVPRSRKWPVAAQPKPARQPRPEVKPPWSLSAPKRSGARRPSCSRCAGYSTFSARLIVA